MAFINRDNIEIHQDYKLKIRLFNKYLKKININSYIY